MPIKKRFLTTAVISLALMATAYFFQNSKKAPRQRHHFLQSNFSGRGMADRTIQLKLNFEKAESNSEKIQVSADVSLPFDFDDKLFFKWKLGQDVFLLEGNLNGQLNGLRKNEVRKIEIYVSGFSRENNHHIGFEIYGIKNGKNIFADGLIASDMENTFENTVQNVERIKASQ